MARQFAFTAVLVAFFCSAVMGADPWIGKKVFWKVGARAMDGNKEINIELMPFPSTVEDVNGEWLWLGRAWLRTSDVLLPEQALDYYAENIRKNPLSAHGWRCRGAVWINIGESGNAIKDCTEAIRLNPKDDSAYNARGHAWGELGELDNAIKDFTEAIRIDPRFGKAYANRGKAWKDKGELDDAIQDYTEAIRLDPKNAAFYNASAWLSATCPDEHIRDGKKAVANATTACKLSLWKNGNNIDTLAAAYAEAGDFPNAIKCEERAIALTNDEKTKSKRGTHLDLFKAGKPFREEPKK